MKLRISLFTIILAASVLLTGSMEAQVADYGPANGILSFEESSFPVHCSKGSGISLSSEHSKLGQKSLKWEWRKRIYSLRYIVGSGSRE